MLQAIFMQEGTKQWRILNMPDQYLQNLELVSGFNHIFTNGLTCVFVMKRFNSVIEIFFGMPLTG